MITLYRDIIKEAWYITWRRKFLWFFGLFAVLLGNGGEYEILIQNINAVSNQQTIVYNLQNIYNNGRLQIYWDNIANYFSNPNFTPLDQGNIKVADLTGGAPEMNPDFRWFVEELYARGVNIMVRSNLTIILANPKYHDLPNFFKKHKVEVISSLPHFSKLRTDAQRGEGVFAKSIEALKMLNAVGYGREGTALHLNLVFNPA